MTGWQTMDSAPKDGTDVLLFFPRWGKRTQICIGCFDVNEHYRNGELSFRSERWNIGGLHLGGNEDPEPAYWMPLPEAPAEVAA